MRQRQNPFRTLDDPAPAAGERTAEPLGVVEPGPAPLLQEAHSLGYWQMWPAGRPAWWRRALVRLVLGWKWRKL